MKPHPKDVHVGQRIKERRLVVGITQEALGAAVGVSFQQMQKYERADNRVSAGRLHDIALALKVPVSYFFEELEAPLEHPREMLETVKDLDGIGNGEIRAALRGLVKAIRKEMGNG